MSWIAIINFRCLANRCSCRVSAAKIKNSVEKNDNVQVKSESVLIKPVNLLR